MKAIKLSEIKPGSYFRKKPKGKRYRKLLDEPEVVKLYYVRREHDGEEFNKDGDDQVYPA